MRSMKKELRSYLMITLGMFIYSIAALGFLVPHKIVGGGATGLSTIIYYLTDKAIPVGIGSVIAGMLTGIGIALALAEGGSTGGTDIVAMIVTKYRNISPGKMIMYCDCLIIACSLVINFNIEGLMYGYVMMGVVSFTVDFVLTGKKQSAQLFIFTDKYKIHCK